MSVDFDTAKRVVQMIQRGVQLDDEQYGILFKGCMVGERVDYRKFLNVHKQRFTQKGSFPQDS